MAWSTEWWQSHRQICFIFWIHLVIQNLQQCRPKKKNQHCSHWANCPLLQFVNSNDYCVSCWLENQNKLPAHGSLLLFHIDAQTLAVNYWKECLTAGVWLTVFWNNFFINQTVSLVSLSSLFFWVFCLLLLRCCSSAHKRLSVTQVEPAHHSPIYSIRPPQHS